MIPFLGDIHISKIRGIDVRTRARLRRVGINYSDQLLTCAGRTSARHRLADQTGIDLDRLTRLVQRADLARVMGVGAIFADMLEAVDVESVTELAGQSPEALHGRLVEINRIHRFARRSPTPEEVDDWVRQASALPALVD